MVLRRAGQSSVCRMQAALKQAYNVEVSEEEAAEAEVPTEEAPAEAPEE